MSLIITSFVAAARARRNEGDEILPPQVGAALNVSWMDNSGIEDGFRIYTRKTSVGGSYTLSKTTLPNVTTATISLLDFGTSYDVKVASFNAEGEYAQVGPVTRYTPPEFAPTGVSVSATRYTDVDVTYSAPASAPFGYQGFYRVEGSSPWISGPESATLSITFSGLTPLTSYQFMVRGYFPNASQAHSYSPQSAITSTTTIEDPVLFKYRFAAGEDHTGWTNATVGGGSYNYNDTTRSTEFGTSQTLGQRGGGGGMYVAMEPPAHSPQDEMHYACGIIQEGGGNAYIFFVKNLIHVITSADGSVTLKTNGETVTVGTLPSGTIPRNSLRYVWLSVRRKIGSTNGYVTLVVSSSSTKPTPSGSNSITGAFTDTATLTNIGIYKTENIEQYIRPLIASRDEILTITL
jgi:hypothetical protein